MFEGFTSKRIKTSGAEINLLQGGNGSPCSSSTDTRRTTSSGIRWRRASRSSLPW